MSVKFDTDEKLVRVSDFYKNPDGSLQDKEGRFQIMFQGNDYVHPVKLCTAFLNMAIFVNRPPQKVQLKLSGDAHFLKFEISLVESTKDEKTGGEDSDPEETEETKQSQNQYDQHDIVETELPPNPDL